MKDYLYPLLNLGIIDKVRSSIDNRANIYFPVETGTINTLFSNPNDPRLEVTDPIYYPSKEHLEDSCRTIIEYCSKDGGVNDRKYRLVDHEGKDITPEELTERYLYNPEVCFKKQYNEPLDESKNVAPPQACSNILTQFSNNNREESSRLTDTKNEIQSNAEEHHKPLEQWTSEDFLLVGCIYCINNGDYRGPIPLPQEDYERHIVMKHAGKPAYPGPADIKLYGLTLDGNGKRNSHNSDSKARDAANANLSDNGVMGERSGKEAGSKSNK